MITSQNVHAELKAAFNARDYAKFGSLLHPEYSYMGGDGQVHAGGPSVGVGIAQMYAAAFPDAKLEVLTVLASGNSAAAEYRATGTHQGDLFGILPSGKSIDLQIANLIELRDGLIYREREYIDMNAMFTQIGAR